MSPNIYTPRSIQYAAFKLIPKSCRFSHCQYRSHIFSLILLFNHNQILEVLNASCHLCILLLPYLGYTLFPFTCLPIPFFLQNSMQASSLPRKLPDSLVSPGRFTDEMGRYEMEHRSLPCSSHSLHINPNRERSSEKNRGIITALVCSDSGSFSS